MGLGASTPALGVELVAPGRVGPLVVCGSVPQAAPGVDTSAGFGYAPKVGGGSAPKTGLKLSALCSASAGIGNVPNAARSGSASLGAASFAARRSS